MRAVYVCDAYMRACARAHAVSVRWERTNAYACSPCSPCPMVTIINGEEYSELCGFHMTVHVWLL